MTSPNSFTGPRYRLAIGSVSFLLAAFSATACEHAAVTEPLRPTSTVSPTRIAAQSNRQTALAGLARAVALALRDSATRMAIKNDMRASRFGHEHKLEFASYVNSNQGAMRGKLARAAGKAETEIQALLAGGQNMEFYMPVRSHRESWKGTAT
jgi:hypothetical protein